ncbi:MAG: ABC transporter permease [Acidimicrobiales bacterium]
MTELLSDRGAPAGADATDALTAQAQGLTAKPLSPGLLAWRRFRRHKLAMVSAVVLAVFAVLIFFPSLVSPYGPLERTELRSVGPTWDHPFGTNGIRQDQLSRVLHGGQISLQVGVAVALVSATVGSLIGLVAGFYGRWIDNLLMRVTDLFLAIPLIVSLILLTRLPARHAWAETFMGEEGSVRAIITILALFFWMPMARIVRGVVLSLKEKEFVEAARALGASTPRILFRHLLPNCVGPIIVNVTLSVAAAVLTESALSFLGFGVESATTPTWGNLLTSARGQLRTDPHLVWFPGLAIVFLVLCVNYLGDGLRDALDPRQTRNKA